MRLGMDRWSRVVSIKPDKLVDKWSVGYACRRCIEHD